jgi:YD repeat-containing protein
MNKLQKFICAALALCLCGWASADSYEYDKLNRLTLVTYTSGGSQKYSYDPAGNLLALVSTPPDVGSTTTTTSTSPTTTSSSSTSSTSTTTVTSTTTTTQAASNNLTVPFALAQGWNLLGNSLTQPLPVAPALSDPAVVQSVWKWDAANTGWQFYAPSMDAATLQSYANSKNYGVLSVINPGEGYWVNAKAAATLTAQTGTAFNLNVSHLHQNWNLVATGNDVSPSAFNASLSATPPTTGTIPINLTSLWAWDNLAAGWYFYAPGLEASNGLAAYITSKNYLDFSAASKTLGKGIGFWVNKP